MNRCIKLENDLFEWMREIRRTLHQYPELSYQEHATSKFIREKLDELSIPYRSGLGTTGVIATLCKGKKTNQSEESLGHVGLRADMDALPVEEINITPYMSKTSGVMHACGHDGHVAMLLGAAAILKDCEFEGQVSCIFQPAEEHGNGAKKIIEEGALNGGVQAVFAGHIDTHFSTGKITVDEGVICSFADPFTITLSGRSGHAARPHEARDPIVAGAHMVTALQTLVSRETDPNQAAVLTVGRFQAGKAHNIIADEAIIDGTVRTSDQEVRDSVITGLKRIVNGIAGQFDIASRLHFHDSLPAVINSKKATEVARAAALAVVESDCVISQGRPSLGAEDFAFYQQVVDGCLVRFGADNPTADGPAHSGTFDFDEDVLVIGAKWLAAVALEWLDKNKER